MTYPYEITIRSNGGGDMEKQVYTMIVSCGDSSKPNISIHPPCGISVLDYTNDIAKLATFAIMKRFVLKNTKDELPPYNTNVLVWVTWAKSWEKGHLTEPPKGTNIRDYFCLVSMRGTQSLKEDGHTFWFELPPNPEIE